MREWVKDMENLRALKKEVDKCSNELNLLQIQTMRLITCLRKLGLPQDIEEAIKQLKRMIRLAQKIRVDLYTGNVKKARRRIKYFEKTLKWELK